ncbi:MAG: transglycosylase domain-containing protein [Candidatus Limnocylindrales bacterium]
MLGLVLTLFLLVVVGVTGAAIITVGGATAGLIAALDRDLPDVKEFENLTFPQPTTVVDRGKKKVLATFLSERRDVVSYKAFPQLVLDATTAVEDRTFWSNQGFDIQSTVFATIADLTKAADRGGASSITQQLVRARLLPKDLFEPGADIYTRKAKEIIQAAKLTQAYPGEKGKERIITSYLNQIPYGHNAYGFAAASRVYFDKPMHKLSLSQVALLAGLPQSPSVLDPYRYSKKQKRKDVTRIVVETCRYTLDAAGRAVAKPSGCQEKAPVVRRNFILRAILDGYTRWTRITPEQYLAALNEPIVLANEKELTYRAPHFVWAMKTRLDQILADRDPADIGGYKVITTLDWDAQQLAERSVTMGATLPFLYGRAYNKAANKLNVSAADRTWINRLRGRGSHNAALVALDYRNGDVLAYVGSADYYDKHRMKGRRFNPKYDVAGIGYRQPGSAWKPMVYATAIDERKLTAGSVLLDITTQFSRGWSPKNADGRNRGPVLARYALQQSLNIPAIRTYNKLGSKSLDQYTARAGITFLLGRKMIGQAGLTAAIGTLEVRLLELTAAYGGLGNKGQVTEPRFILEVLDSKGKSVYKAGAPVKRKVWSPQAAWITTNILAGNSDPNQNPYWGKNFQLRNSPDGRRRIMALKTGTTNGVKDVSTYGFLPEPGKGDKRAKALAVGVWMGNSDSTSPRFTSLEVFATDSAGKLWKSFMNAYTRNWRVTDFRRPRGVVQATIDGFTGGRPGRWTRSTRREWFIKGTEPGSRGAVDEPGLLYDKRCGGWLVDLTNVGEPVTWTRYIRGYMNRVGSSRGGVMAPSGGGCPVRATPKPRPSGEPQDPGESPVPDEGGKPKPDQGGKPKPDEGD